MPAVIVERHEDMSPRGMLRLVAEPDGDVIVVVEDELGRSAEIQFCASGGRSPATLRALRDLMATVQAENETNPT